MSLEAGVVSFAALTCLALAMPKHRTKMASGALPPPRAARILGWALLAVALATAVARFGPAFGVVAWIGQISIAGALLALLMSWRPAYAPTAGAFALACAPLLAL
jgi:hypothetical protein